MSRSPDPASEATNRPAGEGTGTTFRMSTTAGVGSTDYAEISPLAVISTIAGVASALTAMFRQTSLLLLIPVAAIVLALLAMRQIRSSAGTLTGLPLAAIGLTLGVALGGFTVFDRLRVGAEDRRHQVALASVIEELDTHIKAMDAGKAYDLFDPRFRARVPPATFTSLLNFAFTGPLYRAPVADLKLGPHLLIDRQPGQTIARSLILVSLQAPTTGSTTLPVGVIEEPAEFVLINGVWRIHNVATWFPSQAR